MNTNATAQTAFRGPTISRKEKSKNEMSPKEAFLKIIDQLPVHAWNKLGREVDIVRQSIENSK